MYTLKRSFDFPDNGIRISAAQDKPIPGVKGTRVWEYYDLDTSTRFIRARFRFRPSRTTTKTGF